VLTAQQRRSSSAADSADELRITATAENCLLSCCCFSCCFCCSTTYILISISFFGFFLYMLHRCRYPLFCLCVCELRGMCSRLRCFPLSTLLSSSFCVCVCVCRRPVRVCVCVSKKLHKSPHLNLLKFTTFIFFILIFHFHLKFIIFHFFG